MKKDVVAGLGEIGYPILKILSKKQTTIGYDIDKRLMNKSKFKTLENTQTSFLHIAIPVTRKFDSNILQLYKKFKPECIVVHSTISPGTTERIQKKLNIPVIYSATRGIHKRMLKDIKRYTKFFVISKNAPKKQWAIRTFSRKVKNCGVRTRQMSKPETTKTVVRTPTTRPQMRQRKTTKMSLLVTTSRVRIVTNVITAVAIALVSHSRIKPLTVPMR